MNTTIIGITIIGYILILWVTSRLTSRRSDNSTFFTGNRQSPWYIVAIGMVGASISGVTFVSVPGWVKATGFTYMQMVFGYMIGYIVIANILLPLYYKMNLVSIYKYLESRFGPRSHKTGAAFFIISRLAGSSARLYLMVSVLQFVLFDSLGVPFYLTTILTLLVVWLYTNKAGIRTIIFTDTVQTILFVSCVAATIIVLAREMDLNLGQVMNTIANSQYSKMFEWTDWRSSGFFWKQIITGAFITIVMTGLDQDMMQKNLSCRSLPEAKKNMYWYGFAFIPVNLLFLSLGAMLYLFAATNSIELPAKADDLFPAIAAGGYLPPIVTILFILGLMAAALSSADSTLTALTTSFAIDILDIERMPKEKAEKLRRRIHIIFTIITGLLILVFFVLKQDTIISAIFTMAGYTYGPLLGLYFIGLFTKLKISDKVIPYAAISAPLVTGLIQYFDEELLGFRLGYEALLINAAITVILMISFNKNENSEKNHLMN
jgi:Na+/proline symporter